MSETAFQPLPISALQPHHDFAAFDCGDPARNAWLSTHAMKNEREGFSRTFVAVQDGRIAAFYALSAASVLRRELPAALRRNAPDPLPIFLLGQLAVDRAHQGRGLATSLVLDAFRRTTLAAEHIGCRFLGVSPATPELVAFYGKFDFRLVPDVTPPLMVLTVPMIRAILAAAWADVS